MSTWISVLALLAFFMGSEVMAQLDTRLGASARSYPSGAAIEGEFGYGQKIWDKDKILYGYIRPFVHLKSSLLVNSASAGVEFFPISFFGFSYTRMQGHRTLKEVQGRDCKATNCSSSVGKNIFSLNTALAYKDWVMLYQLRREFISYKDEASLFSDEFSGVLLTRSDRQDIHTLVIGFRPYKEWLIGGLQIYAKGKNTDDFSSYRGLLMQKTSNVWSYGLGVGLFRNIEDHTHGSALFLLKYNLINGLRLF
ncbi:hypothetical protein M899_1597 [Bacteriovorax sp. BSW11_IV]|uniref:hypothetical protein n=1 Tax=Bacteriovorax sp. BSW11_IV TaxID=1353529 RepID=UPI00038A3CF3|nr:hypothetical protein [Bacteriovorax sp. BSW11_IV]EQC49389.1 hypothetical protein M899_1597 [Bacteriovorax sp. BSW11_IV]